MRRGDFELQRPRPGRRPQLTSSKGAGGVDRARRRPPSTTQAAPRASATPPTTAASALSATTASRASASGTATSVPPLTSAHASPRASTRQSTPERASAPRTPMPGVRAASTTTAPSATRSTSAASRLRASKKSTGVAAAELEAEALVVLAIDQLLGAAARPPDLVRPARGVRPQRVKLVGRRAPGENRVHALHRRPGREELARVDLVAGRVDGVGDGFAVRRDGHVAHAPHEAAIGAAAVLRHERRGRLGLVEHDLLQTVLAPLPHSPGRGLALAPLPRAVGRPRPPLRGSGAVAATNAATASRRGSRNESAQRPRTLRGHLPAASPRSSGCAGSRGRRSRASVAVVDGARRCRVACRTRAVGRRAGTADRCHDRCERKWR